MEINRAARRPVSLLFVHSLARKKVETEVRPAKIGAKKTHTFLMSTGKHKKSATHLKEAAVAINPG